MLEFWGKAPYFANPVMECTIAPHENRISKNIITGSKEVLLKLNETPDNTIKDNLLYATGKAGIGDTGEQSLTGDPGFISAAKGDYRLSPTSPAYLKGIGAAAGIILAGPDSD